MSRRSLILAASLGNAVVASTSFAAFTFSYVPNYEPIGTSPAIAAAGSNTPIPAGLPLYSVDVYAFNNGGDSGTGVFAVEMLGSDLPTIWATNAAGTPQGSNYDGANGVRFSEVRSYVTAEDVNDGDPTILTETWLQLSTNGYDPAGSWGNAIQSGVPLRAGSVSNWRITGNSAAPVADATLNGGKGLLVGHIVIAGQGTLNLTTQIGGSVGPKTTVSRAFSFPPGDPFGLNINSITPNPVHVVFGPIVSNGVAFQTVVNATDVDGDLTGITLESDPNVSNVVITPGANGDFTITGLVNYAANMTTLELDVTATDSGGRTDVEVLSLVVTPEPASLSLLGLGGLLCGRRRK